MKFKTVRGLIDALRHRPLLRSRTPVAARQTPTSQGGFTLIELLVVIAIIGVLSTIVLSSLSSARSRGADAAIRSSINNMRAQAELFYDEALTYGGMCDDDNINDALTAASNAGSAAVTCVDGDDVTGAWAIEAQLVASTSQYYCVDYTGASDTRNGSSISNASGGADAECDS